LPIIVPPKINYGILCGRRGKREEVGVRKEEGGVRSEGMNGVTVQDIRVEC